MRFRHMLASVAIGVATLASSSVKAVEIEYWQYVFDTRVKAMTQLIEQVPGSQPGYQGQADDLPLCRLPDEGGRCDPGRPGP